MGRKNATRIKKRNQRMKQRLREKSYGKLFNGNVYAQGEFIFIWIILLAYIVGMWIFCVNMRKPLDIEDCMAIKLTLKKAEVHNYGEGDQLNFTVQENDTEYIMFNGTAEKMQEFTDEVQSGTQLNLLLYDDRVVQLESGGKVYLSLDEENASLKETQKMVNPFFGIVTGVCLLFVAVSWYVMYNAEKFPRLIKLFVKPCYINKQKVYPQYRKK